jgi:hypothetical protein
MTRVNRGMMQALQRYTPEYKEQVLNRAERTWRPENSKTPHEDRFHDDDQIVVEHRPSSEDSE